MKQILIVAVVTLFTIAGCSKDKEVVAPSYILSVHKDTLDVTIKQAIQIEASNHNNTDAQVQWFIDDKVVSTNEILNYSFEVSGFYQIKFRAENSAGIFEKKFTVNAEPIIIPGGESKYVTKLFEYRPAPGQFINKSPGNITSAESILNKSGLVTLGAWGGSIILGFDHTVLNNSGDDILVVGNPFTNFAEPGIVYVMRDDNGNGKPDDTWYELAGVSFDKEGYKRNFSVTYHKPALATDNVKWTDSEGNTGYILKNNAHKQGYYPEWEGDTYTLTGSWLSGNLDKSIPNNIKSFSYAWGYVDNTSGGDKLDIQNAVDKNGKPIQLKGIDFIKIQTAVMADLGWLGELSTEIRSVEDLHFGK
ncbi:MAG: cell surface protein [Chitinophagaceae bacterium]|nr:MAG: cell surface protein [Chitinophagaceae bacterium]